MPNILFYDFCFDLDDAASMEFNAAAEAIAQAGAAQEEEDVNYQTLDEAAVGQSNLPDPVFSNLLVVPRGSYAIEGLSLKLKECEKTSTYCFSADEDAEDDTRPATSEIRRGYFDLLEDEEAERLYQHQLVVDANFIYIKANNTKVSRCALSVLPYVPTWLCVVDLPETGPRDSVCY